ncbi:MAG: tetratricopeptide repeat protein [Myxococcota bacterium]
MMTPTSSAAIDPSRQTLGFFLVSAATLGTIGAFALQIGVVLDQFLQPKFSYVISAGAIGVSVATYRFWIHKRLVRYIFDWGWHSGVAIVVGVLVAMLAGAHISQFGVRPSGWGPTSFALFFSFVLSGLLFTRALHRLDVFLASGYKPVPELLSDAASFLLPFGLFYTASRGFDWLELYGLPIGIAIGLTHLHFRRRSFLVRRACAAPLVIPLTHGQRLPRMEDGPAPPSATDFLDVPIHHGLELYWSTSPARANASPQVEFRRHLLKGDLTSARRALRALRREHSSKDLSVESAYLAFFNRKLHQVIATYFRDESKSSRLAALAACVYRMSGDYERAASIVATQLAQNPNTLGREYLLATLADILFDRGNQAGALEAIREAYELEPNCPLIAARHAFYRYQVEGSAVLEESLSGILDAHRAYQEGLIHLGIYSVSQSMNQSATALLNASIYPTWSMTILRMMASLLVRQCLNSRDRSFIRPARRFIARCYSIDPRDPITNLCVAQIALAESQVAINDEQSRSQTRWLRKAARALDRCELLVRRGVEEQRRAVAGQSLLLEIQDTRSVIEKLSTRNA